MDLRLEDSCRVFYLTASEKVRDSGTETQGTIHKKKTIRIFAYADDVVSGGESREFAKPKYTEVTKMTPNLRTLKVAK
jgi:hypothetical protein